MAWFLVPEPNRGIPGIEPGNPRNRTGDPFSGFSASQNAQKLAAGGPGAPHVEVLHGEMRRVHVAEPNPAPEGQALHGSVGDGAAKAGVLQ